MLQELIPQILLLPIKNRFKMDKNQINNLLYIKKDYSKIKELLKNSQESWSFDILAGIYLNEGDIQNALKYYEITNNSQFMAYCYLIKGEYPKAKTILLRIKNYSSFTKWLLFLTNFINGDLSIAPTFLQIRNFYEQDLERFIRTKQYKTVNKIIAQNVYLERFNREIYKYTARVFLNNNLNNNAENFLKKSLDICYKDPETHFLLGEIYSQKKDKINAIKEFEKANAIFGEYIPAKNRLKDLRS